MKNFKKTLITFALGCLCWGGLIGLCGVGGYMESSYTREVFCSDRYSEDSEIIYKFTDFSGNTWEWVPDSCSESYQIGESYKLIMFDEKTPSIYDDSIVRIEKK